MLQCWLAISLLPFDADSKVLGHVACLDGLNADRLQVGRKGGKLCIAWGGDGALQEWYDRVAIDVETVGHMTVT